MRLYLLSIVLLVTSFCSAQEFFQNSFENETGWSLSHDFDDGNDDYSKRDSAVTLLELGYTLTGFDGDMVLAFEDTDGLVDEAPSDGIITLTLDPIDIVGREQMELTVKLSCNDEDMAYDQRDQINGDYLDIEVRIDGGSWINIAEINSNDGGSNTSRLFDDRDMDGNGGELGELPLSNAMSDFVFPINSTGNSMEVRLTIKMDGSDEVLVLDDIRLRESEGDDVAPSVYSAAVVDQNTLEIVFQEPVGAGAEMLFHYAGVTGLSSATIQADPHTVILEYSTDFVIGEPYQLLIFSVPDLAGNLMSSAYNFPFYFNPTSPELVITEMMYNDPSLEDTLEFIEIYNMGSTNAIIGGLRLEGAVSHTLASVTLPAGGFYLVARNADSAELFYGMSFYDYGGQLSDNSELLQLVSVDGDVLDEVEYNDNVPWPSSADGFGPSMELVSPELDNALGNNWVASTNGLGIINDLPLSATPGALSEAVLPIIQFDNGDLAVNEQDGVIQIDMYIAASNDNPSVIALELIPGTASSPADHGVASTNSLSLSSNSDGVEQVAFPLVNDALIEGVEFFTVRMTAVSNCSIGLNDELTVIIADDDYVNPVVFINELQASNATTIMDEDGEFDDWFEVYNPTTSEVDLAGFYISDDPSDPLKMRMDIGSTETVITSGGYLLLWADEQGEQGGLHVNFKLSAGGESLLLTGPDGTSLLDQIDFPAVDTDVSYGRFCDGEEMWVQYDPPTPTPGAMNCPLGLPESSAASLEIYPNPVVDVLHWAKVMPYELIDALGRTIRQGYSDHVDMSDLPKGVYVLRSEGVEAKVLK